MAQALAGQLRERAFQEGLGIARRKGARYLEREVKDLAKRIAAKLEKQIRDGSDVTAIGILISLAILKDGLLDIGLNLLFGVGLIPVIGQIPGWIVSGVLYYFMLGKGYFLGWRSRGWYRKWRFILGFVIDGLPLVDDLPATTLMVVFTIKRIKKEARAAKEKLKKLSDGTAKEIQGIGKELDEY